jgi:hypothetical protein
MNILCLRLDDGRVQPIAYTEGDISKRSTKRLLRKFRKDSDVCGYVALGYDRLYNSKSEVRLQLPKV